MASSSDDSSQSILKTLTLGLLVFDKRDLVAVPSTTTVEQALAILQRENLLALPVYNENANDFIGMISISDIMAYVAFGSFRIDEPTPDQFRVFRSASQSVADLLSVHREAERVWAFNDTDAIESVLEPMSKGVHRVLVRLTNNNNNNNNDAESVDTRTRVLTQSDLIRFLISYSVHARKSADGTADVFRSIAELHLIDSVNKEPIHSIAESSSALDAYRILEQHNLQAAPVIDANGVIVSTISASDLRGLRSNQLINVLQPVLEFLRSQRHGAPPPAPVTCKASNTLYEVATLMILRRVHRVWVVDDVNHPIGCVSMTDVICKYSPYDYLV